MWYVIRSDELCHHGILGQKWGKRNGPPYPLGARDHSSAEKKAGWRKSLDKGGSDSYNKKRKENTKSATAGEEKHGLSDGQKRALKIGAVAIAAGLAAYGGYKVHQFLRVSNAPNFGPDLSDLSDADDLPSPYNDSPWDLLEGKDLERLERFQKEALDINVELRKYKADGSWKKGIAAYHQLKPERQENCGQCTLAGISCFYGRDAVAKEDFSKPYRSGFDKHGILTISEDTGISQQLLRDIIPSAKSTAAKVHDANQIIDYITRKGSMTTGAIIIPKDTSSYSGHIVQWINLSGVPIVKDNQIGFIGGVKTYLYNLKRSDLLPDNNHLSSKYVHECSIYSVTKADLDSSEDLDDFIEYSRKDDQL